MSMQSPTQNFSRRVAYQPSWRQQTATGEVAVLPYSRGPRVDEPTGHLVVADAASGEVVDARSLAALIGNLAPLLDDLEDHFREAPKPVMIAVETSLAGAIRICLELLPQWGAPEFALDPDLEVSLEWYGRHGASISVSVAPEGRTVYAARTPDGTYTSGTFSTMSRAFSGLPRVLKEVLE